MSQLEFKGLGLQRENLDEKRRKMNFYKTSSRICTYCTKVYTIKGRCGMLPTWMRMPSGNRRP